MLEFFKKNAFQQVLLILTFIQFRQKQKSVPLKVLHAHAQSYTPFTINITWSDVNVNQSTLFLYYVYYRLLDVQPPMWSVVGFPTTGPNQLIDLMPGTWYGVRIMAAMDTGNGISTDEFKVITLEGRTYFLFSLLIVSFVFFNLTIRIVLELVLVLEYLIMIIYNSTDYLLY